MRAALRDTVLYFDVEGAGLVPDGEAMRERPAAMIVHGGPGWDHTGFKPALSPLAGVMQLIYFDHRGSGRSAAADPAHMTLDENVEDMEALRRHLGLAPVVSIGTSYGGMVAMAHAARYPSSVSHLVLIATAAHHGFVDAAERFVAAHATPAQQAACARLFAGGFETPDQVADYEAVMGPLYSRRFDPATARIARARTRYAPAATNRAYAPGTGTLRRFDLRPELARITAPTLILAGRHDWICQPRFSEEIHALLPGSTLRVFEEASHSLRADVPDAMNDAISRFVIG